MPYRSTPFCEGSYYHLYNRGNNREAIFFEQENYSYFLREIREYLCPHVDVVAYVLMPNHYHLLVYLKSNALSDAMHAFTVSYTKAVNKRHSRVGALFQGRFQAIIVDKDKYLTHLSRYIHLNPLKAGLVAKAENWEFSSYRDYLGMRNGTLPKPDPVLAQFPSPDAYRQFVEDYAADEDAIGHLKLE
ncbi:MAG: transposase [Chloroflexi bacterium]|nr:transposase [Chloroflexota bacterium]